jgi:catechol 2,3-dioxygenase-like lactoylglutathione lyase family enzyme
MVRDFAKNRDFFLRLGLKLIVDDPPHYARFECPGNAATFSIDLHEDLPPFYVPQAALYFELPSKEALDEYCRQLEGKGFTFKQRPEDKSWLWREAQLNTPEGHDVRLYYAGHNRLDPPWKVTSPT